jgi:predicted transcriptional regulator
MTLKFCNVKIKIDNIQILENTNFPPWELKKQKAREEAISLELRYFFDTFSVDFSSDKSLVEISKDLDINKSLAFTLIRLLEYRDHLISHSRRGNRGKSNVYRCTDKGKNLIYAISRWKSNGIKIPKHLKTTFELVNRKIKYK